jgi:hypothetical protein
MITMTDKMVIKEIGLQYAKAIYSTAGDELIHNINDGGFTPGLYNRRHIGTSGSFTIHWMVGGTVLGLYALHDDESLNTNLQVYPYKDQACGAIKLTALENNSAYYCILPTNSDNKIADESFDLTENMSFTTQRGRLYISNSELTANGNVIPPFTMFSCVYNVTNLISSTNGKIASFYLL